MLQYESISPNTLDLLKKIQSLGFAKDLRLVGGIVFCFVGISIVVIENDAVFNRRWSESRYC